MAGVMFFTQQNRGIVMDFSAFRHDGTARYNAKKFDTGQTPGVKDKAEGTKRLAANTARIEEAQVRLFAEGRQSLLVVFQAMDAAGKDGTIKHVFSGVNPEGIVVSNFKQPSAEELAHDYLWRVHRHAPARGMIGIFNRSHYESVLVERVLNLPKTEALPGRSLKNIWADRYQQINNFEQLLYQNGTTILKFFLNISADEQRKRFLSRLEEPAKQWKFSQGDMETSARWDDYTKAFTECVNHTATPYAPWYVVPADKKWYARLLVSQVVADTLKAMDPKFPKVDEAKRQEMAQSRPMLEDAQNWPHNIRFN